MKNLPGIESTSKEKFNVDSKKKKETKEKLVSAFFKLYENNKIESITIQQVAELAGYNRGTFYLYFKNIYDLLQKIEQEILDDVDDRANRIIAIYYSMEENLEDCNIGEYQDDVLRYGEYMKVLNGENGDSRFRHRMKNLIKEAYRKHLKDDDIKKPLHFEYLLEYLTEANMSIIQYWLSNHGKSNEKLSLKEVMRIMHVVSEQGFRKAFEKYTK